jgi:hypothetical protein
MKSARRNKQPPPVYPPNTYKTPYQGSCKGVGKSVPMTTSAVPISLIPPLAPHPKQKPGPKTTGTHEKKTTHLGPLGAQNCPDFDMSRELSIKSIREDAASSGVTAT